MVAEVEITMSFAGTGQNHEHHAAFLGLSEKLHAQSECGRFLSFHFDGVASITEQGYSNGVVHAPHHPQKVTFTQENPSLLSWTYDWWFGRGREKIDRCAVDILKAEQQTAAINKLTLIGYSRGCLSAADVARQVPEIDDVTLVLIDPVIGNPFNPFAKGQIIIPKNVSKVIRLTASHETLPGFNSAEMICEGSTEVVNITFPSDHLTLLTEIPRLLKQLVAHDQHPSFVSEPSVSTPRTPDTQWDKRVRDSFADDRYSKFKHGLSEEEQEAMAWVDTYYKDFKQFQPRGHAGFESLLTSDTRFGFNFSLFAQSLGRFGLTGKLFERFKHWLPGVRDELLNIHEYTHHNVFINIHHQILFKKCFPSFYFAMFQNPSRTFTKSMSLGMQRELKIMPENTKAFFLSKPLRAWLGVLHGKPEIPTSASNVETLGEIESLLNIDIDTITGKRRQTESSTQSVYEELKQGPKEKKPAVIPARGKEISQHNSVREKVKQLGRRVTNSVHQLRQEFRTRH